MAETRTMKKSIPWLFFYALIGQMIATSIAGAYLVFYMTENLKIAATVMGAILLLARIVDLIIGLVVGPFIQKYCGKHGQFRTWLLYGPIAVGIGCTLCFINPNIPMMAKAVIVAGGYILYGAGMSFVQLSQNGIMSKIAGPDVKARQLITEKIAQGQQTGMIITAFITLPLIGFFSKMGADGYTVTQIIFAVVGVSAQLLLFAGTKEYEKFDPQFKANNPGAGGGSLAKMYMNTLKNSQLVVLIIADTLKWTAMLTLLSLGMYYFTYAAMNPDMMTVNMIVSSIMGLVGAFVGAPIARKLGKKSSAIATGVIATAGYFLLGFFSGGNPYLYMVFASVAALGVAIVNSCGVNLMLDAAEYQLYRTGEDNRIVAMSMFGIPIKLGFAFSSLTVAFVLNTCGYNEIALSVENVGIMIKLIGSVPAVCLALYTLVMATMYKITEAKSKEYAERNANLMKEKMTAVPKKS